MTIGNGLVIANVAPLVAFGANGAQPVASSTATRSLVSALDAANLDAIATVDPMEPGAFVAALRIKGGQLFVVRARHPSVDALSARLSSQQFRDVYIDLQATPTAKGKLFVMDSGADGLPVDADQPEHVDIVYEDGTRQIMFNGARAQKLHDEAYLKQLQEAEAKYMRLLSILQSAIAEAAEQRGDADS